MNQNEKELKKKLEGSKKCKSSKLINENCETKAYIKELNLHDARILFKHRSSMTQYVKFNYKNDSRNAKTLWKCECGKIDSESHLLCCSLYAKERENLNINDNNDLCKYLHNIRDGVRNVDTAIT